MRATVVSADEDVTVTVAGTPLQPAAGSGNWKRSGTAGAAGDSVSAAGRAPESDTSHTPGVVGVGVADGVTVAEGVAVSELDRVPDGVSDAVPVTVLDTVTVAVHEGVAVAVGVSV